MASQIQFSWWLLIICNAKLLDRAKLDKFSWPLHNIIGNALEVESEIVDDNEVRLKVKDLPAGYYLLSVKDESSGFKGVYKFLKR